MRRVVIVGTSGSGKTTLGRAIGRIIGVPHLEIDALHWRPNWTPTPTDELIPIVARALDVAGDGWTICGHYGQVRNVVWPRADTIIWLDYPLGTVMPRLVRRTFERWWRKTELWNGNRERLWTQLCTGDSLWLYTLNSFRRRKYQYPRLLRQPEFSHLRVLHFRSPAQTQAWLERLKAS